MEWPSRRETLNWKGTGVPAMDAYECIRTKLDVRRFSDEPVADVLKMRVLEAARLTGSGINRQHWRFVLVQSRSGLRRLAADSTSGGWVEGASFAVIVLTDPTLGFHKLDAGRALQDMQLAAWNFGIASGLFTGLKVAELRKHFLIPDSLEPTAVVGFGRPLRRIVGRKARLPLREIAFLEAYGEPLAEVAVSA